MRKLQKKVCLLGDFSVGKTSLIRRYVEGRFDDRYLSTIGVKISRKALTREDHLLNLLIWDLAGGNDFSKAGSSYLRGASGALIVCDLSREKTVDALTYYAKQLRAINEAAVLIFIGNKADLIEEREISDETLAQVSHEFGARHLLTSALTGRNVETAFHCLADLIET